MAGGEGGARGVREPRQQPCGRLLRPAARSAVLRRAAPPPASWPSRAGERGRGGLRFLRSPDHVSQLWGAAADGARRCCSEPRRSQRASERPGRPFSRPELNLCCPCPGAGLPDRRPIAAGGRPVMLPKVETEALGLTRSHGEQGQMPENMQGKAAARRSSPGGFTAPRARPAAAASRPTRTSAGAVTAAGVGGAGLGGAQPLAVGRRAAVGPPPQVQA